MHLIRLAFFYSIELLVLLKIVEGFPLFLYHVAVSEREVTDSFNRLHAQIIVRSFTLLVFQDLVGLDKRIDLVSLILLLVCPLFVHLLALKLQQALLIGAILDLIDELSVSFLMDLVNDLTQEVIVVRPVEDDSFIEAVVHFTVNEACHERVWN